ncbi:UNVERIFIED_ORG: hypothetical protein GGD48_005893 [Rhizobium etli]
MSRGAAKGGSNRSSESIAAANALSLERRAGRGCGKRNPIPAPRIRRRFYIPSPLPSSRAAQRSVLILRCPAGASKDEGGWLVASPVLRGSALWASHLRMRLERGRAISWREGVPCQPPSALPGISPTGGEIRKRLDHRSLSIVSPILQRQLFGEASAPSQSPHLWGRCPAGQRGAATAHRKEAGRRQAQRSALILRRPAGASKDGGGWLRWPAPSFEASPYRLRASG